MPDNISNASADRTGKKPVLRPFFLPAFLLLLLFWGVTMWLTRWQGGETEPEEAQRAVLRAKYLAELRADNVKKLGSYAWLDRTKGSVQIPITEAMKLTVAELATIPPHAAYPVATPVPNKP